jgi:general secretion pathway protein M
MISWWEERAPRERKLLLGLASVVGGFALYQFILQPALHYRRDAERSYREALSTLDDVERAARELQQSSGSGQKPSAPARVLVNETAAELGLSITRLQPSDNGLLDVWFDEASPPLLFSWMARLYERHHVPVMRVSIQRGNNETVRAQITLQERP